MKEGGILFPLQFTLVDLVALLHIRRQVVAALHQFHIPLIDKVEFVSGWLERQRNRCRFLRLTNSAPCLRG
jgi:hypothetical protein